MAQDEFGFDTRVINVLQKKDEFINATEQTFFNSLSAVEQQIFKAVWAQAQKMNQEGGNVLFDEENIDTVNKIQKTIQTALQSSSYPKDVKEYLRSFENIKKFNLQANESVNELDPKEVEALVNPVQKAVVNQTLEGLTGSGVDTNFIQPVKEGIFKNVVAGSTMADLEKTLRQLIISGAVDSKLKRYVTQVSRDALNQFDGQVNSAIANEFGLDAYRYVGSLIDDSRPQCIRWAGKQVLLKEDLQKEIAWATSNGTGMIAGTTPDNFATFRGGYNCRHSAIPFKLTASQRAKLQQEAPEKEAQIEVQQAQAKAAKEQEKVKQQEAKVEAAKEQVQEAKVVAKEKAKKAALYKDIKVEQINESNDPDEQYILSKEEQDYYLKISGVPEDAKGTAKMRFNTTLDDSDKRVIRIITVDYEGGGYDFGRAGGKDQGEKMMRTFYPITKIAHNDYFRIQDNSKYKGKGAQIFANQVAALTNENYKFIETQAARGSGNVFNGYYTWARLGYEPSPSKVEKVLSKFNLLNAFNTEAPKVKTWGELLGTKYGQKWWKENGDTFEGTFDLTPNSYSQTTLKNYLESKGKPQQTAKEIEAIRKAEEKARKQAEAEARRKAKEEERKRKEEERKRKEEERARKKAEAEAKRKAKEEERARKKAEAEAKRKAKEEEKARKAEEKKRKEEEAARKKAEAQAAKEAQKKKPASFTLKNQEEVDAFTKDSVLKQTFLHSTSIKNVDSIKSNGFNTEKIQIGRYFGNGVYVTDDPNVAEVYARMVVDKTGTSPATLSLKVNVKKPFIFDQDEVERRWIATDRETPLGLIQKEYFEELVKKDPAFGASYYKIRKQVDEQEKIIWEKYQSLEGKEREKYYEEVFIKQPNGYYSAMASAAKENGYDAFYFKHKEFQTQGGQQLVVFDANNVRVINQEFEPVKSIRTNLEIKSDYDKYFVEGKPNFNDIEQIGSEETRKKILLKYVKEIDPEINLRRQLLGNFKPVEEDSINELNDFIFDNKIRKTSQGEQARALGYDKKPYIVSQEEFDQLQKSNRYYEIRRGVEAIDIYDKGKKVGQKSAQQLLKEFKTGAWFDGNGIYGNGTYFDRGTGRNFQASLDYAGGKKENIMKALLPKDAKIIDHKDAHALDRYFQRIMTYAGDQNQMNASAQFLNEKQALKDKGILTPEVDGFIQKLAKKSYDLMKDGKDVDPFYITDIGQLATMIGYDAIWIEDDLTSYGQGVRKYLNLLNRSRIITTE